MIHLCWLGVIISSINPFHATGHFLYPLKVLENLWFYDVFWGYKKTPVVWNRLSNQVLIEIAVAMDAVVQGCSVKDVFFKNSQNLQGNTCAEACNFIKKETMTQLFSCELCEIFKNKFYYRIPLVASSVWYVTKQLRKKTVPKCGKKFRKYFFPKFYYLVLFFRVPITLILWLNIISYFWILRK